MAAKPVVLLAGITGMMGDKIAREILDKNEMELKAIVRSSSSNASKQKRLDELKARGVILVEGDLLDKPSLLKACEGVEAIVCAANASANDKIMVEGQTNLIEAAEARRSCGESSNTRC
jgi:nucleoside-diphosphate-sugar epimerase